MTFEEAVRIAIRSYYNGDSHAEYDTAKGGMKYTKSYFDKMDKELLKGMDKADDGE